MTFKKLFDQAVSRLVKEAAPEIRTCIEQVAEYDETFNDLVWKAARIKVGIKVPDAAMTSDEDNRATNAYNNLLNAAINKVVGRKS